MPLFQVTQWARNMFSFPYIHTLSYRNERENHSIPSLPCHLIYLHSTSCSSVGLPFTYPNPNSLRATDRHFQCQILFLSLNSRYTKWISSFCTHSQLFLRSSSCMFEFSHLTQAQPSVSYVPNKPRTLTMFHCKCSQGLSLFLIQTHALSCESQS